MKITFDVDDDGSQLEDRSKLTLSNDDLDNPNFVDLDIQDGDGEYLGSSVTVSIEDLFRAAELFNKIRLDRQEEAMLEIDSEI